MKAALLFYAHDGHSGENDLLVQDTDVLGGIADGVKSFLNLEYVFTLPNDIEQVIPLFCQAVFGLKARCANVFCISLWFCAIMDCLSLVTRTQA